MAPKEYRTCKKSHSGWAIFSCQCKQGCAIQMGSFFTVKKKTFRSESHFTKKKLKGKKELNHPHFRYM